FLGISSQPKGLPFLLETLLCMDKNDDNNQKANQQKQTATKNNLSVLKGDSILKKINLYIHARGVWMLSHLIKPISEKLNLLEIHDGYAFDNLPDILYSMNYGVVPPLWYDNAPQVVFEMMAMKVPVIGADIGGIPDFVKDMDNGILFKPGDKIDLASKISMVVNNREFESKFRKNIVPMKTPDQHAQELEEFYIKL
ncbi:MAG: glycosyltransferase, partial [Desulfamplus sp.]|nr:glycosyltransferase [Desulfamplus sp.]